VGRVIALTAPDAVTSKPASPVLLDPMPRLTETFLLTAAIAARFSRRNSAWTRRADHALVSNGNSC